MTPSLRALLDEGDRLIAKYAPGPWDSTNLQALAWLVNNWPALSAALRETEVTAPAAAAAAKTTGAGGGNDAPTC